MVTSKLSKTYGKDIDDTIEQDQALPWSASGKTNENYTFEIVRTLGKTNEIYTFEIIRIVDNLYTFVLLNKFNLQDFM